MTDHLSGIVEAFGQSGVPYDATDMPLEANGALRYRFESGVAMTVGDGAGILAGVGTPRARAFLGLMWAPQNTDKDADGILNEEDSCPTDPEDADGFEDADGCPDPDNDGDGILDVDDKCPNEKEVFNGFEDEDGCPDKGAQLVEVKKDKIQINEKIQFATNSDKIVGGRSFEILDAVFKVLDASGSMKVRIEGHTDTRGKRKHNMKLSKRRARSVKRYLEKKGIDGERMEPVGLGPDEPISSNATKAGRATNRRVEFHITDQ